MPINTPLRAFAGASLAAVCLLSAGCRQDMHDQPRYKTLGYTTFFADGRQSRPLPEHTVARGDLRSDPAFYEGKINGVDIDYFPIPVTKDLIERGQNRFDIYCSPCHGRVGNATGMIVRRGFKQPPSYHIERLRTAPVGHFYDVITNGYGAMLNYSQQIQVRDRWAIVAYIRALQYSQNALVSELPAEIKAKLPENKEVSPSNPANPNRPKTPVSTANPGAE